jgi:hypothetical protein
LLLTNLKTNNAKNKYQVRTTFQLTIKHCANPRTTHPTNAINISGNRLVHSCFAKYK